MLNVVYSRGVGMPMWSSQRKSSTFTITIFLPEEDQATCCASTVMSLGHPERRAAEHDRANFSPVVLLARANSKVLPGVCSDSCVEGCLDSHSTYDSKTAFLSNRYILLVDIVRDLTGSTVSILKSIRHE